MRSTSTPYSFLFRFQKTIISMNAIFQYYQTQSLLTDPGQYAGLLDPLPDNPEALIEIVQGLLIHKQAASLYGIELSRAQREEQHLRTIQQRLQSMLEIDKRGLLEARLPADRQIGVCRDFALLLIAFLRHKGTPARLRVGFAEYLAPGQPYKIDHWVTEFWDFQRKDWRFVDPQIDQIQRRVIPFEFDPQDLVVGKDFYPAGSAWQLAHTAQVTSNLFRFNGRWKGFPCIRGNLLHDFQALNKVELLPWDYWDDLSAKDDRKLSIEEKQLLDHLAVITQHPDEHLQELQDIYASLPRTSQIESRLRILGIIQPEESMSRINTAIQLQPSGSEHLAELNPSQSTLQVQQLTGDPYDIPPESGLAALQHVEILPDWIGDIQVRGARQHNLKHIDVRIPRNRLVVITGVSGSGKSSLAFDTIYAEGQRRYLESLSSYARQFVGQMEKPQVDQITGLSPAVAIEQKTISRNPRSTVGTVTEILDYLRVLFARLGVPHCPNCGRAVQPQSAPMITRQLSELPPGTKFQLLAPIVRARKGAFVGMLRQARKDGFTRVRLDGQVINLTDTGDLPALDKMKRHTIELVVDRLVIPDPADRDGFLSRLTDSVETCLHAGNGTLLVDLGEDEILLSEHNACPDCQISFQELQPNLFSFNSPLGMCPECNGLGIKLQVDPELIISKPDISLLDGASIWYGNLRKKKPSWSLKSLDSIARHYQIDLETPWNQLPEDFRQVLLYGSNGEIVHFEYASEDGTWSGQSYREIKGIIYHINRLFRQTKSEWSRRYYMQFMRQLPCPMCQGERLCPEARFVTVAGKRLPELTAWHIAALHEWITNLLVHLASEQQQIGHELIAEIQQRLTFLRNVGLHYLALDRPAPTLSGGEGQRIRLASQIGSGLVGVLYILDEPSIGLHARDHRALLDTLTRLRDLGNTVLVVEHDAETMRTADWLIDLGPGPGILGGEVVAAGTPDELMANPESLTGRYLSGQLQVTAPNGFSRRAATGWLTLHEARLHNLKNLTVRFPLGTLICISGVSGSGKSSLIAQTLFPALARQLNNAQTSPGPYQSLEGLERLDKVIHISQSPIGRNPRSNPGTYVGVLNEIRQVFASTPDARALGYAAGRFSFNVKGGRCEACAGYGSKKVEMHFLPDVWVRCKECAGKRFNHQTLAIQYKGKNIAEVLEMDVQQALSFFENHPKIQRVLQTLHDVGLDYIKLGQSALTLSGGEAQRVKLAKELSRVSTGRTLYFLDEPTTGLHFADIQRLLDVLHRLVDAGNTVIVIEHNLDVIRTADWVIDLGPEGGDAGGDIVAEGTPEEIALAGSSYTGQFLRNVLQEMH